MNNHSDGMYVNEALVLVTDRLEKNFESDSYCSGTKTGFDHLDSITCGLNPGDLVVIGGRPSTGKTILAINILEYICYKNEMPVLLFNLEMTVEAITERMLSCLARIHIMRIRSGQLDDQDWPRLSVAIKMLADKKLKIKSGPTSLEQIVEMSRAFKIEHGNIGVIVIDHIHLIECTERQNVHEELAGVTKTIKNLALELNVPIIVTSALNRNLELRVDRRPLLNDLRGSGSLEDDADIVLLIYRPEFYDRNSQDPCQLIIAKNRGGPIGTIRLNAFTHYHRFENYNHTKDFSALQE